MQGELLTVQVEGASFGGIEPVLSLHDESGDVLTQDSNTSGSRSASITAWTVPYTGVYYLQVTSSVPGFDAVYEIQWSSTGRVHETESASSNNIISDTGVIELAWQADTQVAGLSHAFFAGQMNILDGADSDWFRFTGNAGERIAISSENISHDLRNRISLYSEMIEVTGAGLSAWNQYYKRVEDECGWRGEGCRNNYKYHGSNKHVSDFGIGTLAKTLLKVITGHRLKGRHHLWLAGNG